MGISYSVIILRICMIKLITRIINILGIRYKHSLLCSNSIIWVPASVNKHMCTDSFVVSTHVQVLAESVLLPQAIY